jgi:hypothetical protein
MTDKLAELFSDKAVPKVVAPAPRKRARA